MTNQNIEYYLSKTEENKKNLERKVTKDSILSKLNYYTSKVINKKIGVSIGLVAGGWVYYANSEHGFGPAALATSKQFAWSFLFGGSIGRLTQYFARLKNKYLAWTLGEIIPLAIASSTVYAIHKYTSTPEPLRSVTFPAVISAFVFGPIVIYTTRKGHLK